MARNNSCVLKPVQFRIIGLLFLLLFWVFGERAFGQTPDQSGELLKEYLQGEVDGGRVVGAQLIVGSSKRRKVSSPICLGTLALNSERKVTGETVFCIASCSKPIASALIFTLVQDKSLRLNQPVSDLIPQMRTIKLQSGKSSRSPTLQELLAHRGGIYSQMAKPNKVQLKAIRDFQLSLDESVNLVFNQPLSWEPGTKYAYSGAGYCLLASMAEKSTGKEIETLLQDRLCVPLGMNSTTYFPDVSKLKEIANGGIAGFTPPHTIGDKLKLPLFGGSIYSTALDLERFVQMILNRGRVGKSVVLRRKTFDEYMSIPFPAQTYGNGWLLRKRNKKVILVSHLGSLPPYQSALAIDLVNGTYRIVLWTLAKPADIQTTKRIREKITSLIR